MAENEETGLVSLEESDHDSSFEVIDDPKNPSVSRLFIKESIKNTGSFKKFSPIGLLAKN